LQDLARPAGSTVVSGATLEAVNADLAAQPDGGAAAWTWEPLGDREFKGRTATVAAYRLVSGPAGAFVTKDAEVLP
jgi:class 3 adenylate cyclase